MTSRYITMTSIEKGPEGGYVYTRDVWRVPSDFTDYEERLFAEMCAEGVVSENDAIECVRLLRK